MFLVWIIVSLFAVSCSNNSESPEELLKISAGIAPLRLVNIKDGKEYVRTPEGELRPKVLVGGMDTEPLIFQGDDATEGEQPWMASLQVQLGAEGNWYHICGASLIKTFRRKKGVHSLRYALTAAHCLPYWGEGDHRVALGLHDMSGFCRNCQYIRIDERYNHPNYTGTDHLGSDEMFDIAVLKLDTEPTITDYVQPVLIATKKVRSYDFCNLTGWGRAEEGYPYVLKKMNAMVLHPKRCEKMWRLWNVFTFQKQEICTLDYKNFTNVCSGDSGGPLVCPKGKKDKVVAGVVSWGTLSCDGCLPSVYARVSGFKDFINNTIFDYEKGFSGVNSNLGGGEN